eukprot:2761108-Pleurochrysis_carterae.AAC.2
MHLACSSATILYRTVCWQQAYICAEQAAQAKYRNNSCPAEGGGRNIQISGDPLLHNADQSANDGSEQTRTFGT